MPAGNHVHIISAGEWIHLAYPAAFRTLPSISRTFVLADEEVYGISKIPEIEKQRQAVRSAVSAVKEISASLSITFSCEIARHPVYHSVRTILTTIHRENPKARFTFDLTGGSKELCLALMSLAPWMGGEVFSAFDEKNLRTVPLPDRSIRVMMANPNYQTILAVLLRNCPNSPGLRDNPYTPRQYLFQQVWPYYIRSRIRTPKPTDPVIHYIRGRKPANDLSQQTFSTLVAQLRLAGLIDERPASDSRKERAYRISGPGETAFRFFANPATNSIVKMMLEKT